MKVSSARRLNRRSRIELALLNEPIQWIGSRPTGLQITAIVFVGTIGILILGVQPIVLAALLAEQHITLTQLGHAASVELLSMGLTAALAGAALPPRRLRAIAMAASLLLAYGNWQTIFATGETVTALRALTGAAGGLLIWVTSCMIARSSAPDRWAGIYLTVQTLAQFILATVMSAWAETGASMEFGLLAGLGLICAPAALLLPSAFAPLPKTAGQGSFAPPSPRGFAALAVAFLVMMFIVSIWVYYDPLARHAGLTAKISDQAVSISLACQVLGGIAATVLAGRLRWYPVFVVCALVDFGLVTLLGSHPPALVFLADAAVYGFIWLFILPFLVPMAIEADPSRRSAVLVTGVGLLGGSLGPTIVAMIISPEDMTGALWLGGACLLLSLLIATALRFTHERSSLQVNVDPHNT